MACSMISVKAVTEACGAFFAKRVSLGVHSVDKEPLGIFSLIDVSKGEFHNEGCFPVF